MPSILFKSSNLDLIESHVDRISMLLRANPSSVNISWYADLRESKVGFNWVFNWVMVSEMEGVSMFEVEP